MLGGASADLPVRLAHAMHLGNLMRWMQPSTVGAAHVPQASWATAKGEEKKTRSRSSS